MSRKWLVVVIGVTVVVGIFAAIKLMPLWATLVAVGSFVFGILAGYSLKKRTVIEKPVEVIKEVLKRVEVPVEKVVYVGAPVEAETHTNELQIEEATEVKQRSKRRNRNKKVTE